MNEEQKMMSQKSHTIRFMPIGDSYTIGNGLKIEERWPNLLVESLKEEGIYVEIIRNPAVSGYTAQSALEKEIPKFERDKPDFATLFIGTNDSFQSRNLEVFRDEYVELINRMQNALTNKDQLVIITIPRYVDFPGIEGSGITNEDIEKYNQIIREEASKKDLKIIDLYQINTLVGKEYFISDGVHPNANGVKIWHDAIYPVVFQLLK